MALVVHVLSGRWAPPSESPFCLKLMTWLRMADIPHETVSIKGPPKSKSGKAPYVTRDDGSLLEDSSLIIDTLTRQHGVSLDAERTPAQQATMVMLQRMVENHLYFALLLHRWRDHWPQVRAAYFEGSIPAPVLWAVGPMIRRGVIKSAHGHGMGRMPWSQALDEALADIGALGVVLGDQDYFLGTPGVTDAIVYGTLENLRGEPMDGPLKEALMGTQNLVQWLDRMRARYWD